MSQTIKDRFSSFLNEIEQMEKDNEKLTEDIRVLEKEKSDGYSKFDTDTHLLIERRTIEKMNDVLEDAYSSCDNMQDEAHNLESLASDFRAGAGYARDEICEAANMIEKIIKSNKEEEVAE